MNVANLTKQEATIAYHRLLQVQLGYSLGTTTFSKTQLRPIQTVIDQAYKSKIGFQNPQEYNGHSNIPIITAQGFKKTQLLIGALWNEDDIGKLDLGTLQYKQLESRLTALILEKHTNLACHTWTTQTWISSLKKILHSMRAETIIPAQ